MHNWRINMHAGLRRLLTVTLSLAFFVEFIDATVLNTSLPKIAQSFDVNPIILKVAIIVYLLSVGLFLPVSSYFADKIGTKKVFIFANVIFAIGSIGCGLSNSIILLTIFRITQGIGGAFLAPTARLILVKIYPKDEIIKGQSLAATIASTAYFSGPILGGAITHYLDWRLIFFINIPINIFAIIISAIKMPTYKTPQHNKFDIKGYLYIAIALVCLLLFCDSITAPYIANIYKLVLLVITALSIYLYFYHNKKTAHPIIEHEVWQNRKIIMTMCASFIMRIALNALPFLIPLMLQSSYHFSALVAGLAMSVSALGFFIARPIMIPLHNRFTDRKIILIGQTISLITVIALTSITYHLNWYALSVILFTFGLTQSCVVCCLNVYVYRGAPERVTSRIIMLNSSVIQLSASFAIAIAAAYIIMLVGEGILNQINIPLNVFHYIFIFEAIFILISMAIVAKTIKGPPSAQPQ